jgi:hypothetical protein
LRRLHLIRRRRFHVSLLFFVLSLVCFGLVLSAMMGIPTLGHLRAEVKQLKSEVPLALKSEGAKFKTHVVQDLVDGDFDDSSEISPAVEERAPASAKVGPSSARRLAKINAFAIQQEKKRFLWACLQLERKPVAEWKRLIRKLPELSGKQSLNIQSALLMKQWNALNKIVEDALKKERNIASTQTEMSVSKIRKLRERFLKN